MNFYSNLNMRDVTDNKMFWKKVRPLFTDKIQTKSKITLIEKKVLKENPSTFGDACILPEHIGYLDNFVHESGGSRKGYAPMDLDAANAQCR